MSLFSLSRASRDLLADFDRFFEQLGERPRAGRPARVSGVSVYRADDASVVEFDLPGVARDRLSIEVEGRTLTVRGHRPSPDDGDEKLTVHRSDVVTGDFERSFELGDDADAEAIEARYSDGVLQIRIPRSAAARKRSIPIRTPDAPAAS